MNAAPVPRKSVKRRILLLFLLCGLLPVAATIVVSYQRVSTELLTQRASVLRGAASNLAAILVDRLTVAERLARAAAAVGGRSLATRRDATQRFFRAAVEFDAGRPRVLFGRPARLPSAVQLADVDRPLVPGASTVLLVGDPGSGRTVWMALSESAAANAGRVLAFELDPGLLWSARDVLPYLTEACVLDASGRPLECALPPPPSAIHDFRASPAEARHDGLSWSAHGTRYVSGVRELFLRGRFGAESWLVVVTQPAQYALGPIRTLAAVLIPVVLLGLLVASLLGLVYVRRTMQPLNELTQAAGRIAVRDFDVRVTAAQDDEFGLLARSFNAMSARLGRQFKALKAQSEIDAVILSSVELDSVVSIALHRVAELAHAEHYYLLLADPAAAAEFRLYVSDGADGVDARQVDLTRDDVARLRTAMRGKRITRQDLPPSSALNAVPGQTLFTLAFPLGTEIGGALILGYDTDRGPDDEEVALLWELGDRVAVALATARRDQELHRRAYFDSLTGLPNRALAMEELAFAVAAAERQRHRLAVLFVDLDDFSAVNDSLGHAAGDAVLTQTAARLRACVRKSDVVARLSSDEFAVVLTELRETADAALVAGNMIEALSAPFSLPQGSANIAASVGVAIYPVDATNAEELLKHADLALYRAKRGSAGTVSFFEPSMNEEVRRRLEMDRELRTALEQDQMQLYYQPQLDLKTGRIVGCEALIRWIHPERGLVSPTQFIGFAEASGLIEQIGQWVLKAACAQFVAWHSEGLRIEYVSVNVSARQFQNAGLSGVVAEALQAFGVPPRALHLEVTESAVLEDRAAVRHNLSTLTSLGTPLELDDFGIGYSSLAHLKNLPVAAVKLDRTFIESVHQSASSQAVVRAAIDMAHALGKTVVAEGVEHGEELALLVQMGCDVVQGYYISAPVTADHFAALLRQRAAGTPFAQDSRQGGAR
jgi:diguanylate cyclase (GGDEF)-like protein